MKGKFHKFSRNIDLEYLMKILNKNGIKYKIIGKYNGKIEGTSSLDSGHQKTLIWSKKETLSLVSCNHIIISNKNLKIDNNELLLSNSFILVDQPKYVYNRILIDLIDNNNLSVKVDFDHLEIEKNKNLFQISNSNTFIDPSTEISPGAVIFPNVKIGKNCKIGPNSIIGAQGFGLVRNPNNGLFEKVIHIGGVIIGDNVTIASNCCIDSGMINETFIDSNVAIDNLVHISHNCRIMNGSIVASGSVICGGTLIKKNVWVAPNAVALQNLVIGENSVLGAGTVLRISTPDNSMVYGNPMKIIKNYENYENNINNHKI